MATEFSVYEGAFFLPEDVTLAEVWIGLHADASRFHKVDDPKVQASIDENSLSLLRVLADCTAERWATVMQALGITQTGAVALSWCSDAGLSDVAAHFSDVLQKGGVLDVRAARLLAPKYGAEERRLSALIALAENDVTTLVLLCLGDPAPLVFDVDTEWLGALPEEVKAVLRSRYDGAQSSRHAAALAP